MNGSVEAPIVSVVITCYNQARFLSEAIESVLKQSYRHFEIIVVDDGSKDDPAQVASLYHDVRFIRQENEGVSAARNAGLHESKGTYIVFLDADDRLLPNALETGVRSHQANQSAAFVYGQYQSIDIDGTPSHTPVQVRVDEDHYSELLCRNYIGLPGMVMYRRNIFETVGEWDRRADHAGDWELYLRIAKKYPIFCHHQPIVEYRQHGANTSGNYALMMTTILAVLRSQRPYLRKDKKLQAAYQTGLRAVKDAYGEALFEQMRSQMRTHQWRGAWQNMLVLLRIYPQAFVHHTYRKIGLLRDRATHQ